MLLSDRVVLLSANPGRVRGVVSNPLPRPRNDTLPDFRALVNKFFGYMTDPERPVGTTPVAVDIGPASLTLGLPPASLEGFDTFVSWSRSCGLFHYSREQDHFRRAAPEPQGR